MLDDIDNLLDDAIALHEERKFFLASVKYLNILEKDASHADTNHNFGLLKVDLGLKEEALIFLQTAINTNPSVLQYWVTFINTLTNVGRFDDAGSVLEQAHLFGHKDKTLNHLRHNLDLAQRKYESSVKAEQKISKISQLDTFIKESGKHQTNILDDMKLNKALKLAKRKIIDGLSEEAKKIYQDILVKFPKNKRALDGLKGLAGVLIGSDKVFEVQDPPQDQQQSIINLFGRGQIKQSLQQTSILLEQFPHSSFLYNVSGAAYKGLDQLDAAVEAYKKAILINPNFPEANNNIGLVLKEQGKLEAAIEAYTKAISLKPDYAHAHNNMGNALQEQGKLEEAIKAFKKALSIKPDYAEAHYNMGNALQQQGKMEGTIEAYKKALTIKPGLAEAYNNMGITLKDQGKLEEAIEAYNKALSIMPEYAQAYYNLGNALTEQVKLDEAIKVYSKALSLKPDYAHAHNNMGNALQEQGKPEEARKAYKKAISLKPDYAEAWLNLGSALKDQGKLDKAIEAYNKALSIKPNYAEAYNNLGIALQDQGKLDEAIKAYTKALSIKPDYAKAHYNLSFALLNIGRLKEGVDEYEWRWKTAKRLSTNRNFSQPLWDGKESLKGKTILLWSEQGIGDTINWSSCLSFVAAQAEHCILECPQKLVPLLARSFPNVEFKPEDRSLDPQRDDFDYHLPMGSLFRHFISKIPPDSKGDAFLIPDPARVKYWRKRLKSLGKGPYIGIGWKSSNMSPQRMPNYASISDFAPIFEIPDATFINMQYNDFKDDLTKIQNEVGVKIHNFDDLDQFENLEDVAALCGALDIVVSTHNVLIMIAPRVGTLTKFASWRQSVWNNILLSPHGPAIDKFDRNTWEPWENIFRSIAKDIVDNDLED